MSRLCNHCHQPIGDFDAFCANCGSSNPLDAPQQPVYQEQPQQPVYQEQPYQQPYQQQPYQQQPYQQQPYQQQPYQQQPYQQPYQQQPYPQQPYQQPYQQPTNPPTLEPDMPMKWFKFVIWVQLFLAALSNLSAGFQALNGAQYDGEAELIYSVFPDLQGADTLYGVLCIIMAILAIVVRFRLSGYKKDGPTMYLGYLAGTIVIPIIYGALASAAMAPYDTTEVWTSLIGGCIGSGIMLLCNWIYFGKRKHLFVN